jgi:hypothetical protein
MRPAVDMRLAPMDSSWRTPTSAAGRHVGPAEHCKSNHRTGERDPGGDAQGVGDRGRQLNRVGSPHLL